MIPTVFRQMPSARAACIRAAVALRSPRRGQRLRDVPIRYMPSWRSFGVYKIDVNQGNYLSQDMVDKLKVGMTQATGEATARHAAGRIAVSSRPLGLRVRVHAPGQGRRASQLHRLFRRAKVARWEGDEMPESVVELNRIREREGAADRMRLAKRAPGTGSSTCSASNGVATDDSRA